MRLLRIVLLGVVIGGVCAAPAFAPVFAQGASASAKIIDFSYDPLSQTVDPGTTISFTNTGARPHTVTDRGGTFDTGPVSPGAKGAITLQAPGRYFFFCRINPAKMNGVITVRGATEDAKAVRVQALDPAREGEQLGFDPASLTVKAGTAVILANVGGKPHSLTADDGTFDTGIVNPGAAGGRFAGSNVSIIPTKPGKFGFHCEVHPDAMKGTLEVTGTPPPDVVSRSSAPNKVDAKIVDFAFDPKEFSVSPGGTVTWKNTGQAPHTVTFDDVEKLDTGTLDPGHEGALVAPDKPGNYSYRCNIHPAKMRGVMVVVGQAVTDPTKTQYQKESSTPTSSKGALPALALITAVIGAFLGGFGVSAFVRNNPAG